MRPASTEAPGWCDPLKGSAAALNELHSDSGVIGHAVLAQAMFGHVARSLWNALGVVAALAHAGSRFACSDLRERRRL